MEMLILLLVPLTLYVRAEECPTPTTVSNKTRQELLQSRLEFSTDFLQSAAALSASSSKNVFLSPFSVYYALLVAYIASSGKTEESYKRILRIPSDKNKNDVLGNYLETKKLSKEVPSKKYELDFANRIYVSSSLQVKDCMKNLFAEEIQPENFKDDAAGAVKHINSWVAEQTNNLITNVLPQNSLDSNTSLVLVNAVYFKGRWKSSFPLSNTKIDTFYTPGEEPVPIWMMEQESYFRIRHDYEIEASILELPYENIEGREISMYVLLPDNSHGGAISQLEQKLKEEGLCKALRRTSSEIPRIVVVYLPKFKNFNEYDIKSLLGTPPFNSNDSTSLFYSADFSLLGDGNVDITKALHYAKIEVDEEGTRAASRTIKVDHHPGTKATPPPTIFRADHPFLFIIYDKTEEIVLFFGALISHSLIEDIHS